MLGTGNVAEIFAYGEQVLKLYRDPTARAAAFREAAILAVVARHGLPTPTVFEVGQFAGRWGLVMSRAAGEPLGKLAAADPGVVPAALDALVTLQLMVHACEERDLPALKPRLAHRISSVARLGEHRDRLLASLAALPDGTRLCHGDFHPLNLIGTPGALTIVDWPDATTGPPAADACRTYLLLLPHHADLARSYVTAYAQAGGMAVSAILDWLPVLAAARLTEKVVEEEALLLSLCAGGPI
jgi:aminoglycoside phosphotransferase (APT) family kinase protein